MSVIWHGLRDAFLMAWEVWWALVLGFFISAVVQAWVPRERIQGLMSGSGPRPVGWATGLGAASSSCSYAAIAIGKSLFQKGASAASALAFQFASTNLVWELGLVLWVLIGWQFTAAEYLGGIVMIVLMTVLLRLFVDRRLEEHAREHAVRADSGHQHHASATRISWRQRLTSAEAWSDVAHNFRGDWQMLYKEIALGFLLAGFIAQFGNGFFEHLFIRNAPAPLPTIENVVIGPIIAMLSFVCSVGNVPLAAVLWSGGISFAGVLAFLFADLIVIPILLIYRKYYGTTYTVRITALMFVTMVLAALIVDGIFSALGLIPSGPRPTRADIFSQISINYKLALNVVGVVIFAGLFWLTARRGATDPVCGMTVDRARAVTTQLDGRTYYFCSQHCLQSFTNDPQKYLAGARPPRPSTKPTNIIEVAMAERAKQLAAEFDQQIEELLSIVSKQSADGLRQQCQARQKLGDGSLGALISHTADNYQRIAEFAVDREQMPGHAAPSGGHRMPRFLRALGHRPPDHGSDYSAESANPQQITSRLDAARSSLAQIATRTDEQLDAVPLDGSFRFCDGKRTLEDVLRALLKHQSRQLDAIHSTAP